MPQPWHWIGADLLAIRLIGIGGRGIVWVSRTNMIGSEIREIAAARTVPLICAAFNESTAQIWDLGAQRKIGEFSARFAFGSQNLAMHPDGGVIVTGAAAKRGAIGAYTVPQGQLIWLRERVSYSAYLRFSHSGKYISCVVDNKRVERLDSHSGNTVEVIANATDYFEGPKEYTLTALSTGNSYSLKREYPMRIPKLTFGILDAAFGADRLCITESTGPLRCIDCQTGSECWRYTPPDGSHVLRLHYNNLDESFYGVIWHYEKGRFRFLARFDKENGQMTRVHDLTSWAEAFSEATQQLVTSAGEVIDLKSGERVGELAFPLKEYPDQFTA